MRQIVTILMAGLASVALADPPKRSPKLLVLVAVDGLSYSRLEFYRPWYRYGLKRLLDEGQVETETRYRHINTETGPGHAALSTGAPPRVTGIVANDWFEKDPKGDYRRRSCLEEWATTPSFVGAGALRIPTLGDLLQETYSASRVVSLSAKDRAAVLMAGHNPKDAVYWFDQGTGAFVTSKAYEPSVEARAVVESVNRRGAGPGRFGPFWQALPDAAGANLPQPAPNLADFQVPLNGLGFPHSFTFSSRGYFPSLFASPFTDELVADLAVAFVDDPKLQMGQGSSPDFLALSFSAQDVVSHAYGPESEENLDVLRRLDVQLGRVLEAADRLGPGAVALALSADHGFPEIPEAHRARDKGVHGGRVIDSHRVYPSFLERLNRLVDGELCLDPKAQPLLGMEGWTLVYNRPTLPLPRIAGECGPAASVGSTEIDAAVRKVVPRDYQEEIEGILMNSERSTWSDADPAVEFARNGFDSERSGDVVLLPRENVVLTGDPRGTSHGSHHEYDIHVPLVFWGAPFRRGRSDAATSPYDLAPTLAAAIDLPMPKAVGRSLLPDP
jgi:arylsulfatase A-like enzyme